MLVPLMLIAFSACKKINVNDPAINKNETAALDITFNPCMFGNCWTQLSPFPGAFNYVEGIFTVNNKSYLASCSNYTPDPMWMYDGTTWSIGTAMAPPIPYCSTIFTVGSKAYATLSVQVTTNKSLYAFDPTTNQWTALANFPGQALGGGTGKAFSIGNKGYTVTYEPAASGSGYRYALWEYDVPTNSWLLKSNLPKPAGQDLSPEVAFSIGSKAYMYFTGTASMPQSTALFYEFDPATNIWKVLTNFPGEKRYQTASFVLNSYGYIGTGRDIFGYPTDDFYRYKPSDNTWTQVRDYSGGLTRLTLSFSLNNKGYVIDRYNQSLPSGSNYFYIYRPSTLIN